MELTAVKFSLLSKEIKLKGNCDGTAQLKPTVNVNMIPPKVSDLSLRPMLVSELTCDR